MKPIPGIIDIEFTLGILLFLGSSNSVPAPEPPAEPVRAITERQSVKPSLIGCSADGEFFVMANSRGRIEYGRTQKDSGTRSLYQCHPHALAFSPDNQWLAVAGEKNGCPARLKVWDITNGTVVCQILTELGEDPYLKFSPDGRLLASTSDGDRINVWQLPEGSLKCTIASPSTVSRLVFSHEGKALVTVCADGSIQRFSLP